METKTTATTTGTQRTARTYQVGETTAALLDCITAVQDLYAQIADAIGKRYGTEGEDEHAAPFLEPCNALTDLLQEELQGQVIDALMQTSNSHSGSPVI